MTCFLPIDLAAGRIAVLAESLNRFSALGSRFRESNSDMRFASLAATLTGFAVFAVAMWLAARWYTRWTTRVINNPRSLFRELCRAHRLHRAHRRLLLQMAQWHGLSDPVQLFLDPQRFQSPEMHAALDCKTAAAELQTELFANRDG